MVTKSFIIRLNDYKMLEIETNLNLLVREIGSDVIRSRSGSEESEPSRACEGLDWRESSPTLALRSLIGRLLGRRVVQAPSGPIGVRRQQGTFYHVRTISRGKRQQAKRAEQNRRK